MHHIHTLGTQEGVTMTQFIGPRSHHKQQGICVMPITFKVASLLTSVLYKKKSPLKLYFKNLFLFFIVLGTYPTGRNVRAVYNLTLNEPPTPGNCSITPQSGRTLLTSFNVSCQGFSDPDSPLTYTLYQIQSTGKIKRRLMSYL